jgi:hypothetical protein
VRTNILNEHQESLTSLFIYDLKQWRRSDDGRENRDCAEMAVDACAAGWLTPYSE